MDEQYRYPWTLSEKSDDKIVQQLAMNVRSVPRSTSTVIAGSAAWMGIKADLMISAPALRMAVDAAALTGEIEPLHTVAHFAPDRLLMTLPSEGLEQIGHARHLEALLIEDIERHVRFEYLTTSDNEGAQPNYGKLMMRVNGKIIAYRFWAIDESMLFTPLPKLDVTSVDEAKEAYREPGVLESSVMTRVTFNRDEIMRKYTTAATILPLFAYGILGTLPRIADEKSR